MTERFVKRMTRAAKEAEAAGLAGLLITPSADLVYLAGYDPPLLPRLTCLVLRAEAEPVLLVPELERPRALDGAAGKAVALTSWRDGEDPYDALAHLTSHRGTYGTADRMWASHLLGIQRSLPECEFVPASRVLAGLRAVKDPDELELLSRAARGADEAFHRLLSGRLEGQREEEVAATLAELLRDGGHEEVTFTIVASGPNGASPHHEAGSRTIRAGDPVVLDFGGRVGGYCSDMSRTVCVDTIPERFTEVYDVVKEAQEAAFRAVRPGVTAEEVDRTARDVIEGAGFGDRFLHRTGHGIGLDEHEAPYIVTGNSEPLRPGMCFSIEPGIYLEREYGVRIEDIVTVTEDGAARLNRATRNLETVS